MDFFIICPKLTFFLCCIGTSDAALPVTENHCASFSSIESVFSNNNQLLNFTNPKRKFDKGPKRSFNPTWFKLYPRLHYITKKCYAHCVKSIQMRSYFWSEYRKIRTRNNSVYLPIQSDNRKIRTRNNSIFGHFSHFSNLSLCFSKEKWKYCCFPQKRKRFYHRWLFKQEKSIR